MRGRRRNPRLQMRDIAKIFGVSPSLLHLTTFDQSGNPVIRAIAEDESLDVIPVAQVGWEVIDSRQADRTEERILKYAVPMEGGYVAVPKISIGFYPDPELTDKKFVVSMRNDPYSPAIHNFLPDHIWKSLPPSFGSPSDSTIERQWAAETSTRLYGEMLRKQHMDYLEECQRQFDQRDIDRVKKALSSGNKKAIGRVWFDFQAYTTPMRAKLLDYIYDKMSGQISPVPPEGLPSFGY